MSSRTVRSQVTDACTQTDVANTPETTPSPGQSDDGQGRASIDKMPELKEDTEIDYTRIDLAPLRHLSQEHSIGAVLAAGTATADQRHTKSSASAKSDDDLTKAATASSIHDRHQDEAEETNDADDEDDLNDDEEPVVFEVAAVQPASTRAIASRAIQARGNVVTISKRAPPPLPERSPARSSRSSKSDVGGELVSVRSPLRQTFGDSDSTAEKDTERAALTETKADELEDRECDVDENSTIEAEVDALAAREPSQIGEAQAKSLTPQDVDTEVPVTVEAEAEETPVSGAPAEEPKDVEEETGHSEVELKIEEPGSVGTDTERVETKGNIGDSCEPEALEERNNDEDANANESPHEQTDNSDSTTHEKHTSSVYTGATEDRWSCDGSSLTTPTSERRYSMAEDTIEQDTPTKMKDVEEPVVGVAQQPSSEPKMTVPRNVTAA